MLRNVPIFGQSINISCYSLSVRISTACFCWDFLLKIGMIIVMGQENFHMWLFNAVKLVIPWCSTIPWNKVIYEVKFLILSLSRTDMHFMFEFIFTNQAIIGTIPINCWGWLVQKLDKTFTLSSFSENIEKSIHTGLKRSISLLPLLCHLTQYFGWYCRMK